MSSSPANTNDLDEVEPRFVVKVVVLALAIHLAFGPWTYGPYAVIVFFGCWRLSASGSKESAPLFSGSVSGGGCSPPLSCSWFRSCWARFDEALETSLRGWPACLHRRVERDRQDLAVHGYDPYVEANVYALTLDVSGNEVMWTERHLSAVEDARP
jgi:hypothetical protein